MAESKAQKDTKLASKEAATGTDVEVVKPSTVMSMDGFSDFAVTAETGMTGLESVDQSDIKIPVIQLTQPLSELVDEEKAKAGQFYNTATEEAFDSFECSLLQLTKTRVRWPEVFAKGSRALCRSFDGIKGTGDPGMICDKCELKEWGSDNEKPECSQGYNWLGAMVDSEDIFKFTAISSGIKPTKAFISSYLMDGYNKYQLFCYRVRISSEKIKDSKGTYYIPKYEFVSAVTPVQARKFSNMLEGYKIMFEKEIAEAMEAGPMGDAVDVESEPTLDKPF